MATLIEQHIRWLRATGASEDTIASRFGILARTERAPEMPFGLDAACEDDIVSYLGRPGLSANTRNIYAWHLLAYYRWATARGHLDYDPAADIPTPPKQRTHPRPITNAQLDFLLTRTEDPVHTCILLGAYCGLRCVEIATVRREDVTPDCLIVKGKGGSEATVYPHPLVWRAIEPLGDGLIIEQVGGRANAKWISNTCRYRMHSLGVSASMHQLRHWHATALRRAGNDQFRVQQAMRHASPTSTQVYAEVDDDDRRDAILSLPVLGPM